MGYLTNSQMAPQTFQDMQEEMSLWDWNRARSNVWLCFAKCLQELGMEVEISPLQETTEDDTAWSWARATRQLRAALRRIQQTSTSVESWQARWLKEKQGAQAWSLSQEALSGRSRRGHLSSQARRPSSQKPNSHILDNNMYTRGLRESAMYRFYCIK